MTRSLIGMPVSRVWKGFSSALFLELGDLHPVNLTRGRRSKYGEANICIEWHWRVESRTKVLIGSDQSNWAINKYIRPLKGLEIVAIALDDEVKNDLIVRFTDGIQLQTSRLKKEREDGEWSISLKDGKWLAYTWRGLVEVDAHESVDDMSPEELEASRLADVVMDRWGTPVAEPQNGECHNCEFYVPLRGDHAFNVYGVCVADGGPFDGRVVKWWSGCPLFTALPDEIY